MYSVLVSLYNGNEVTTIECQIIVINLVRDEKGIVFEWIQDTP